MRRILWGTAICALAASPASAQSSAFAGRWEAASEDGTHLQLAELTAAGARVSGRVVRVERGYFTGDVEIVEQLDLAGTVRAGVLEFSGTLADREDREVLATGTAVRRGQYLLVRVGAYEAALAPPGVPLAVSAEGSAEAAALADQVNGRRYERVTQAHGGGAYVGERVHLALCADGTISYSGSSLAATPGPLPGEGVDGGSSWSRRGRWRIVLYAGAPAVRADWEGTGTTYSLVDYIQIVPAVDGGSAVVDGTRLPVTGRC